MVGSSLDIVRSRLHVEVYLEEMANALETFQYDLLPRPRCESSGDRPKPPSKLHVIHMSNIPDYVGGALTSFLYGAPVLESGNGTGLVSRVLRNPPAWKSISQYLAEYLPMHDRKLIETHFHLRLSRTTPEGLGAMEMLPLMRYYQWERAAAGPSTTPLTFEALMPRASLARWLHAHFLKICLPYPRAYNGAPKDTGYGGLVYAPFNLTIFMRLLVHVAELGYPAHWLSAIVAGLLRGEIMTTARAPREPVLRPQDVDKVYPARKISVEPWRMELAALVSLWQPLLPFEPLLSSSLASESGVSPEPSPLPAHEIAEFSVRLPPRTDYRADYYPHYVLVFWDQKTMDGPPLKSLHRLLLDDEEGDATTSARLARREGLRVVTTFRWSGRDKTATFWLRRGDMAQMVRQDWLLYVWRTDTWQRQSEPGVGLRGAVVTSRVFGGVGSPSGEAAVDGKA
ncbi:hypothetical protein PG985_001906 [Apiospora marii]|uniref:uncharacterized protein n=1 Tax=Apiospora marii TaxID=335849 RepID=UPI00312EA1CD